MPTSIALLSGWILVCSVASFVLMAVDKRAARSQLTRIRETSLLTLAAVGGWPGTVAGMLVFRHKSQKMSFRVRCALVSALNAWLVWLVVMWIGVAA